MDDDSFRDFVRQRLAWLSQIAFLLTGDHHDAEDLVQCALVKLHRRWPRLTEVHGIGRAPMPMEPTVQHRKLGAA